MFGEYRGELTSSLSLEGRQLGQPIRQLGQLMPVAKIMTSIPDLERSRRDKKGLACPGLAAMDSLFNDICVLVTAAFVLPFVPGLRLQERALLSMRDRGTALLVFLV